eukprot:TRINITY_DN33201_c0_g1_i1.p1 TRINITY_DN33201_c0_g1~~TRINITY_DN33201_c0_g1_i1.p1  ORF type:complete len:400 (+),score=54.29 TRINITY_DN33201_c0_g1_i1:37-1200(+)
MQALLKAAGLDSTGVAECSALFEKERLDVDALKLANWDILREIGVPRGYGLKICHHIQTTFVPSAPPSRAPLCPMHEQPLFALCEEDGELLCRDCARCSPHTQHDCLDAQTAIKKLRGELSEWSPSDDIDEEIEEQQSMIADLRKELNEATQQLHKLEEMRKARTTAKKDIQHILQQTSQTPRPPLDMVMLQEIHKLWFALGSDERAFLKGSNIPVTASHYRWLKRHVLGKHANGKPTLIMQTDSAPNPAVFHQHCDNKGPTLTFIKLQQQVSKKKKAINIVGGFTTASWSSNQNTYHRDDHACLFSLQHVGNNSKPVCFPLKPGCEGNAIYNHVSYGVAFGSGDLWCWTGQNQSNLGNSYQTLGVTNNQFMLSGATVLGVEVYAFQ